MVKIQKGKLCDGNKIVILVLDDNYVLIEPIHAYLQYLDSLERSPNTINSYAHDLKLYWEFLQENYLDWTEVKLDNLAEFIYWLRTFQPGIYSLQPQQPARTESTINRILSAVCGFDAFHALVGNIKGIDPYVTRYGVIPKYKSFLYGIAKSKQTKKRLLTLKQPKTLPCCLSTDEVRRVVNACNHFRDKFLVCLLYETGIRLGEALGLRHEDIHSSGENKIHIIPRESNWNYARVKSGRERVVHVSVELMKLYSNYLIDEYPEDVDSDYVFVNCWGGEIGTAMKPNQVQKLFERLTKKTGIKVNAHLFRHTHATELIQAGWSMAHVQKRLGHANIQTTMNTYVHLTEDDLKSQYQHYLELRYLPDES